MALLAWVLPSVGLDSAAPTSPAATGSVGAVQVAQAERTLQTSMSTAVSSPPGSPSARYGTMMTYDSRDGYVVMFGGYGTSGYLGDTWKFVNGFWTNITPETSPPARDGGGMAYDANDGYVVLFGGFGSSGFLNDTWAFAAGFWTNITPSTSPPARSPATLAYDAKDGYVVLFGGQTSSGYLGDTWTFVGGVWTKLAPAHSPSARETSSMTYDAKDGYVLLFGGYQGVYLDDTWTFVHGVWTNITSGIAPSARSSAGMTYDAKDGYVVLFGGGYYVPPAPGDTWTFAGGVWTQLFPTTSPIDRLDPGLAYDAKDGYVVMFSGYSSGGLGDTWRFVKGAWTEFVVSHLYPTAASVNALVSIKTTTLVDLWLPNLTQELVLYNAANNTSSVIQPAVPGRGTVNLTGITTAGGAFLLAWQNTTTSREFWEKVTLAGKITYPKVPLGATLPWAFPYGNTTRVYVSEGKYLVELNATSLKLVANYSSLLPSNTHVQTVLPLGSLLYLGGDRTLSNGAEYAYFGFLNLTSNKVTTVSKTFTKYPAYTISSFDALVAEGGNIYVGGFRGNLNSSVTGTLEGYFYKYVPSTSAFKNLSSLLPVTSWGVFALEPWAKTIALSLNGYTYLFPTKTLTLAGGIYTLSSSGTSLVNETAVFPSSYVPYIYLVTAASSGWYFSGGYDTASGVSEVAAVLT